MPKKGPNNWLCVCDYTGGFDSVPPAQPQKFNFGER
jgi:hypothetical protein